MIISFFDLYFGKNKYGVSFLSIDLIDETDVYNTDTMGSLFYITFDGFKLDQFELFWIKLK